MTLMKFLLEYSPILISFDSMVSSKIFVNLSVSLSRFHFKLRQFLCNKVKGCLNLRYNLRLFLNLASLKPLMSEFSFGGN